MTLENLSPSLAAQQQVEKSSVQIRLLKGPIYRDKHKDLWFCLERDQFQIREYFQQIGLSLLLDDAEGYAFLKQSEHEGIQDGDTNSDSSATIELPRLMTRRSLSFAHTLLLVLIRKRLAEHDSEDSSPRIMVSRSEIHQWLQPYFATVSNQIKQHRDFDSLIKKMLEMGWLSHLSNSKDEFEVQRIIKAMVNAEEVASLLEKLKSYSDHKNENREVS